MVWRAGHVGLMLLSLFFAILNVQFEAEAKSMPIKCHIKIVNLRSELAKTEYSKQDADDGSVVDGSCLVHGFK